jgi:hypothetical protein
MPRAYLMIRQEPHYRRWAFEQGLHAAGYELAGSPRGSINREDVLVVWNRYGHYARQAEIFEAAGARVVVAENGLFGRDWLGAHWYSIALRWPAAVGGQTIPTYTDSPRWDSLGVNLCGWRNDGEEVIVLAQRGIGPPGRASPAGWHRTAAEQLRRITKRPVRIREHPGEKTATPLEHDLERAHCVVTWASGAALKALLLGVPVFSGFSDWCGNSAARPFGSDIEQPLKGDRLPTLRRLAWTTFRTDELASGLPFRALLGSRSIASPSITARS